MKRQGGEMSRKSRRKPRLYPVFDPLLQSCSEHSDSHLYPKPWNRKEMKPLLAVKLPCHNHRRTKGLTACRVYISYSNSSLSTLCGSNSDGTTSFYPHMHLNHQCQCMCCQCVVTNCIALLWGQFQNESCRKRGGGGGVANISIASKEPRAMNLINNVIWALMLFMLRVGIWIVEIRVWC